MTARAATVTVDPVPAQSVMLLLDAADRAQGDPVPIAASGQPMVLGDLAPSVQRCVLLAAGLRAALPTVTITGSDAPTVRFTAPRAIADPTVTLVEFYRRDGGWKVRALGHGHRDELAVVTAGYGAPAPQPSASQQSPSRTPPTLRSAEQWQKLLAAIWQDASRSAITFADAVRFADAARDEKLEALVADIAGRAPDHPERRAADRRHQDIVDAASGRRAAELDHLIAELAEVEQALPAPLARWDAATWQRPLTGEVFPVIRVGEVTRADSRALRIPMIAALDAPGGLLLVVAGGMIQAPVTHLLQRVLSAGPAGRPVRVIAEHPGVLAALGAAPAARPADGRIAELATEIDLLDMARQAGDITPVPSPSGLPGVLVVPLLQVEFDEPTGRTWNGSRCWARSSGSPWCSSRTSTSSTDPAYGSARGWCRRYRRRPPIRGPVSAGTSCRTPAPPRRQVLGRIGDRARPPD